MYHVAIQKAVEEWKTKKSQKNSENAASEDEEEENIYAVENDVSFY